MVADLAIVFLLLAGFLLGVARGAVRQLIVLGAWLVAFLLAAWLRPVVGDFIASNVSGWSRQHTDMLGFLAAFLLLFGLAVVVIEVGGKTVQLTKRVVVDQVLGGFLALGATLLAIASVLIILDTFYGLGPSPDAPQFQMVRELHSAFQQSGIVRALHDSLIPGPARVARAVAAPRNSRAQRLTSAMPGAAATADAAEELGLAPLGRSFFARDTELVARDLLGVWLCRSDVTGNMTCGRIVETEAYGGQSDLASHARAGRTKRTTPMFGEVGHAYVYLIYGMHECLNVVAHDDHAEAGAVLLRALEPLVGEDTMRSRRGRASEPVSRLASGPARLTQAMAVNRSFDGHDLTRGDALWLAAPVQDAADREIAAGARVGVAYAGEWAAKPLRFWLAGNASVSSLPKP